MDWTGQVNNLLYLLAGVLTLLEAASRWVFPAFRADPAHRAVVETLDSFWMALLVALSLKAALLQPFTIPSGSMEDTLMPGDYILVKKYEYGYSLLNRTARFLEFKRPQRGDVLVFVSPADPSKDYIKRCVGVPGDSVELRNSQLYVDGVRLDEPYVKHLFTPAELLEGDGPDSVKVNFGPVTVEPGHYFMMGDNRDDSEDSRYWGQLDERLIKGKAWLIYWHSQHFRPDFRRMFRFIH
jgi:signal peptidase I